MSAPVVERVERKAPARIEKNCKEMPTLLPVGSRRRFQRLEERGERSDMLVEQRLETVDQHDLPALAGWRRLGKGRREGGPARETAPGHRLRAGIEQTAFGRGAKPGTHDRQAGNACGFLECFRDLDPVDA